VRDFCEYKLALREEKVVEFRVWSESKGTASWTIEFSFERKVREKVRARRGEMPKTYASDLTESFASKLTRG
jgi:hypothetical protein